MTVDSYRVPSSPSSPVSVDAAPDDAAKLLGPLRSVHRPRALWRSLVPAAIAPLSIVGLAVGNTFAVPLVLVVLAALALFLALAFGPLRRRGQSLEVYARGLVVDTGRSRDQVLFEAVDALWYELDVTSGWWGRVARIESFRLIDHDGAAHRVPLALEGAAEAAQWIVRHCTDPLLADAQAALRAGETLTFGKVRIDREGLALGDKPKVAWSSLRLTRLQPGSISLFRRLPVLPWRTVRLDRVPHPTLFARLVRELSVRVEIDEPASSVSAT
jgi:hypothetical protein